MDNKREKRGIQRYVLAFLITATVFALVFFVSNQFNKIRFNEIKTISDKLYYDILSSETQFALLKGSSCNLIDYSTAFSDEINDLHKKITYTEDSVSRNDQNLIDLKKYYSILQIKDYLLLKDVNSKCKKIPVMMLYFYDSKPDSCAECKKMGYVISKLKEDYPEIRIYTFDNYVDLSVLKTLKLTYGIDESKLPATVIDGKVTYGFLSIDEFLQKVPALKKLYEDHEKTDSESTTTSNSSKK